MTWKSTQKNLISKIACHLFTHLSTQRIFIDNPSHATHQVRQGDEQDRHNFYHHRACSLGENTYRKYTNREVITKCGKFCAEKVQSAMKKNDWHRD